MENTVQTTWKPVVAGILEVVAGSLVLILCFFLIIGIMVTGGVFDIPGTEAIPGFVAPLISVVAIIVASIGLLALLGGIYALQRKMWWLALAGSIASLVVSTPLGIAAIIFVAISKNEFE